MAAKKAPKKTRHQKSKASPPPVYAASTLSVATQNVINEEQGHDGCRAR
jgi:hypothetical protein